jgi:hypothetical protein
MVAARPRRVAPGSLLKVVSLNLVLVDFTYYPWRRGSVLKSLSGRGGNTKDGPYAPKVV